MKKLDHYLIGPGGLFNEPHYSNFALIERDGSEWNFDNSETLLTDYRPSLGAYYERSGHFFAITIINYLEHPGSKVTVTAPNKNTIETIFDIIERHFEPPTTGTPVQRGWKLYCRNPVSERAKEEDHQPVA